MKKVLSEDSRRIRIFLLILFLLVGFISIPLFALKAESGGGLVMAASVVFMWLPTLATLITRKLTDDKSKLPLKPLIKKNWKIYVVSAYIPSIAIVLGTSLFFAFFPEH